MKPFAKDETRIDQQHALSTFPLISMPENLWKVMRHPNFEFFVHYSHYSYISFIYFLTSLFINSSSFLSLYQSEGTSNISEQWTCPKKKKNRNRVQSPNSNSNSNSPASPIATPLRRVSPSVSPWVLIPPPSSHLRRRWSDDFIL